MADPGADLDPSAPPPPSRPLERHARIEADLFCDHCGYNLHTQPVVRDARLGILVVRCTECGRFQPAAVATSASRVWLNRLAVMALALWVFLILGFAMGGTAGMAGLQAATIEVLTSGGYFAPDGARLYRSWDPTTSQTVWRRIDNDLVVQGDPPWRRDWRPAREFYADRVPYAMFALLFLVVPLAFGTILSVLLWHVPRRRYWILAIPPFVGAAFVIAICDVNHPGRGERMGMITGIVAGAALLQATAILLGTRIGRPLARWVVTLVVPPKPRQALAFLWTTDGRPAPPAA